MHFSPKGWHTKQDSSNLYGFREQTLWRQQKSDRSQTSLFWSYSVWCALRSKPHTHRSFSRASGSSRSVFLISHSETWLRCKQTWRTNRKKQWRLFFLLSEKEQKWEMMEKVMERAGMWAGCFTARVRGESKLDGDNGVPFGLPFRSSKRLSSSPGAMFFVCFWLLFRQSARALIGFFFVPDTHDVTHWAGFHVHYLRSRLRRGSDWTKSLSTQPTPQGNQTRRGLQRSDDPAFAGFNPERENTGSQSLTVTSWTVWNQFLLWSFGFCGDCSYSDGY